MRRRWKLVAERADKRSYSVAEITQAIVPALEQDCRTEMSPEFIAGLRRVAEEPLLFPDAAAVRFEALRPLAGSGIARSVLDNVAPLSATDLDCWSLICESVKAAVTDRANKGIRQVEEHYLRKESAPRATNVRGRIESAIAGADLDSLVARVLSADPAAAPGAPARQTGLDDGVMLP